VRFTGSFVADWFGDPKIWDIGGQLGRGMNGGTGGFRRHLRRIHYKRQLQGYRHSAHN
jgi:hypothetical protein